MRALCSRNDSQHVLSLPATESDGDISHLPAFDTSRHVGWRFLAVPLAKPAGSQQCQEFSSFPVSLAASFPDGGCWRLVFLHCCLAAYWRPLSKRGYFFRVILGKRICLAVIPQPPPPHTPHPHRCIPGVQRLHSGGCLLLTGSTCLMMEMQHLRVLSHHC